jgi:RHS repeat-associated protein
VRRPWQAAFTRDGLGQEVDRKLPGGVVSVWDRDEAGRPKVHRIRQASVQVSAVGYQWRSNEQLAGLIDTHMGPTWFQHDARSYLVAAQRPDGTVQYRAPDAVGNVYRTWDHSDRQYAHGGRVDHLNGVQYLHDDDGQLVGKVEADGKRWTYTWDFAGQLVEVTRPDGQKVGFAYDALGRRVRKAFAGKTTRYLWDGNDLVHEVVEGALPVTWVFEPGTFAPLAKVEGDKRFSIITDHLGTPTMMADEAGALAWKAQLDLYGVLRADVATTTCPWRWPGQYEDEETGLVYNRFRYYDPQAGRYIAQDPIGLFGGLNEYDYCVDPLTWSDPFGLSACNRGNKRARALGDFRNRIFRVGDELILLTRERMDHILRRHASQFWDGSEKAVQSFFQKGMGAQEVEEAIEQTLNANRERIIEQGTRGMSQISHTIDGVEHVLGFNNGHVGQFYPRP